MDDLEEYDLTAPRLSVMFAIEATTPFYDWIRELCGRLYNLFPRLKGDIYGINFSVLACGKFAGQRLYTTGWTSYTQNIPFFWGHIKHNMTKNENTVFDYGPCMIRKVGSESWWLPDTRRVLVMMGNYSSESACEENTLDWKSDVKALADDGVTIYTLQSSQLPDVDQFCETISTKTGGKHLLLSDVTSLYDTLVAVCYREANKPKLLARHEREARARCVDGSVAADIETIFTKLRIDYMDTLASSPVKIAEPPKPLLVTIKSLSFQKSNVSDTKVPVSEHKQKSFHRTIASIKTTPKIKYKGDKFKESNLPLLRRENVPESNFSLGLLPWSPWRLAIACGDDLCKENKELWAQRFGSPGYSLRKLYSSTASSVRGRYRPVAFEVAVQGSGSSKKRYVVFSTISSCSLGARNWEQRLLGRVRSQVDLVLNSGGRVYVRVCLITSTSMLEMSRTKIRRYDYAWRKVRRSRSCPRDLVKSNFVLSKSDLQHKLEEPLPL